MQILKTKWWKYLLMGVADVEANYTVVKAYQFTTLTSIQVREMYCVWLIYNVSPLVAGLICWAVMVLCVSAAGLLCDPGADGAVLVLPEDSLPAGPLHRCDGVSVGGGGHGWG